MVKLKFPLIKGKGKYHFPVKPICPICKKARIFEPNSFATISGGALLMDRKEDSGGPSSNMDGFLHLNWHGAHSSDGGQGINQDIEATVGLVNDIQGGQFDFYFCSTNCLRIFLNGCVDELENRIEKEKNK